MSLFDVFSEDQEQDQPLTFDQELDAFDPLADAPQERRSGEGVTGAVGDILAGTGSGLLRGAEMVSEAAQWFAPEGTDMEAGAKGAADYFRGIRERNQDTLGESVASEDARTGSAWNPRGWLFGGFESLGMMAPGLAVGGVPGAAVTATQFWGGTAQEAYDESLKDPTLTESQRLWYANQKGAIEGGIEALQEIIPFKISKLLPKRTAKALVRTAAGAERKPLTDVAKNVIKTILAETPMEVGQEYGGLLTDYQFGQRDTLPGWNEVAGVIGPTIIMSGVLGTAGGMGANSASKKLHDALTKENVSFKDRVAAAQEVADQVDKKDPELADMWWNMIVPQLEQNKPVALPLDDQIRQAPQTVDDLRKQAQEEVASLQEELNTGLPGVAQPVAPEAAPAAAAQPVTTNEDEQAPPTRAELDQRIDLVQQNIAKLEANPESDPQRLAMAKQRLAQLQQQRADLEQAAANIDTKAAETANSPTNGRPEATPGQALAGNYKKGPLAPADTSLGRPISIENDKGSTRTNKDPDAKPFSVEMKNHYGYIRGVEGFDKDKLDVFLGPEAATARKVYVVDQVNPETGEFDEHKVMHGFNSAEEAQQAYHDNYEPGWKGFGAVTEMTLDEFNQWADSGGPKRGALNQSIPTPKQQAQSAQIEGQPGYTRGEVNDKGYYEVRSPEGDVVGQVKAGSKKALRVEQEQIERHKVKQAKAAGQLTAEQQAKQESQRQVPGFPGYTRSAVAEDGKYNVIGPDGNVVGRVPLKSRDRAQIEKETIENHQKRQAKKGQKSSEAVQKELDSIDTLMTQLQQVLDCVRA